MGPKSTGQSRLDIEFFDEFDELYSKKPNVNPVSVVSSDVPGSVQQQHQADFEEPVEEQAVHQTEKSVKKNYYTIQEKENCSLSVTTRNA